MIELDQIWKIDPSGTGAVEIDVPGEGPAGLAVDAAGTVYAAVPPSTWRRADGTRRSRGLPIRPDGTAERLPGRVRCSSQTT